MPRPVKTAPLNKSIQVEPEAEVEPATAEESVEETAEEPVEAVADETATEPEPDEAVADETDESAVDEPDAEQEPEPSDGADEKAGQEPDEAGAGKAAEAAASVPRWGRVRNITAGVLVGLVSLAVVVGLGILFAVDLLPAKYLAPAVVADLALAGVTGVLLLRSKKTMRRVRFAVAVALSVVMVAANGFVAKIGSDYISFTTNIQAGPTDTVQYDIVVPVAASDDPKALAGQPLGETASDPNQDAIDEQLGNLIGGVTPVFEPDWSSTISALVAGDVPAIVIDDGFLEIYSEIEPADYAGLKIVAQFVVPGKSSVRPDATFTPPPVVVPPGADLPFIVYLSGIDTKGDISKRSRSDMNQLMVVNPQTGKVLLVNTPRDYYVRLAGTTGLKDKLTHAGIYGIDTSVGTMANLYGIDINYWVRVNFTSVTEIVDAVGGVDVYSDIAFTTSSGRFPIVQGMNHLDGAQALAFARERYHVSGGDNTRGKNQQLVIEAILQKVTQPSVLVNYTSILNAVQGAIQTSMPEDAISAQVKLQLKNNTAWSVETYSVTGSDSYEYTYSASKQKLYVMIPNQASIDTAKQKIAAILAGQ